MKENSKKKKFGKRHGVINVLTVQNLDYLPYMHKLSVLVGKLTAAAQSRHHGVRYNLPLKENMPTGPTIRDRFPTPK